MGVLLNPFAFADNFGDGSQTIQAVVYDGVQGYMLHTLGPAGAVDGAALTFAWAGTFNSDGSAMTLLDIPGTVPVKLTRNADNTITFAGGTAGAVFSNSTTAVAASLGFLIILASCNGTASTLKVVHATATITGTNTPGTATNLDLTADWFFGSDGGAAEFLDADTALWWGNGAAIDFTDANNIEQFWDTTLDKLRDPGATGSNPTDGTQPLVCHKNPAGTHTTNVGSGGNADTAGTFSDGTSPGTYAADLSGRGGADVLAESVAWWAADNAGNTKADTDTTFDVLLDLSGNGNSVTAAGTTQRPLVGTDGDGDIYAGWDGSNDRMTKFSAPASLMNNFNTGGTVVGVFLLDSIGSFGRLWAKTDVNEAWAGDSGATTIGIYLDHATTDAHVSIGLADGTKRIVDQRVDKSLVSNADIRVGVNGAESTVGSGLTEVAAPSGAATDLSTTSFHLGNRLNDTRAMDGRWYELAFWDTELSDTDMALVRTYLADKYSITLV